MKYEDAISHLEDVASSSKVLPHMQKAADQGAEALAFVLALHKMFKETGMTSKEEPDVNELENLIDALHGEIAAAAIFLSENTFARVPDMLRGISASLEKEGTSDTVVVKGYSRFATRIENTRRALQKLSQDPPKVP